MVRSTRAGGRDDQIGHPRSPDGLLYRARHDPEMLAVALHERAGAKGMGAEPLGALSSPDNSALLGAAMDHYGFAL